MNYINSKISILSVFIVLTAFAFFSPVEAENNNNIGFLLTDNNGKILISQNANTPLIPASILKIVTSYAAISYLGENYRYKTYFYYDKQSSDLYIKGFGDPFFISEEINKACSLLSLELKKKGTDLINNIILNNSFFENDIAIPGRYNTLNPYDSVQGALCANFNTIFFKTDSINKIISAEPQTPLLPIFLNRIITTGLKEGRITLSKEESITYPGHLIKYFLENEGIKIVGTKIIHGQIDMDEEPFLIYNSSTNLKKIVQNLLKYSNNFIANQILLTLGAHVSGPPSNLEKSVKVIESFYSNISGMNYVEGSGISRENRLSCSNMLEILIKFMPYHRLMREDKYGFFKTGTLSGIRTRAGYFKGKDKSLYPYIIMINKNNMTYDRVLADFRKKIEKI